MMNKANKRFKGLRRHSAPTAVTDEANKWLEELWEGARCIALKHQDIAPTKTVKDDEIVLETVKNQSLKDLWIAANAYQEMAAEVPMYAGGFNPGVYKECAELKAKYDCLMALFWLGARLRIDSDEHYPEAAGLRLRKGWQVVCQKKTSESEDKDDDEDIMSALCSTLVVDRL